MSKATTLSLQSNGNTFFLDIQKHFSHFSGQYASVFHKISQATPPGVFPSASQQTENRCISWYCLLIHLLIISYSPALSLLLELPPPDELQLSLLPELSPPDELSLPEEELSESPPEPLPLSDLPEPESDAELLS